MENSIVVCQNGKSVVFCLFYGKLPFIKNFLVEKSGLCCRGFLHLCISRPWKFSFEAFINYSLKWLTKQINYSLRQIEGCFHHKHFSFSLWPVQWYFLMALWCWTKICNWCRSYHTGQFWNCCPKAFSFAPGFLCLLSWEKDSVREIFLSKPGS